MLGSLRFVALATVITLLSGCEIIITGDLVYPPGFNLTNASYSTNYRADADGDGDLEFVICDDRTTELGYHFDYHGDLQRWTSFLRGVTSGQIRGEATFTPGSAGNPPGHVDVTYEIRSGAAPLLVTPQGITVVPIPDVIGYTRLYVRVNGYSGLYSLSSAPVPVLAAC
jgi:hypothetical protein